MGGKRYSTEQIIMKLRQACRALGQPRSTQRYRGSPRTDEGELVDRMTELALQCGRYGYRKIARFL